MFILAFSCIKSLTLSIFLVSLFSFHNSSLKLLSSSLVNFIGDSNSSISQVSCISSSLFNSSRDDI